MQSIGKFIRELVGSAPPSDRILNEMLAELGDLRRSHRHIYGLRQALAPFVEKFPRLDLVGDGEITAYLREIAQRVGPRRRDNIRDAIVQLSRYARRREYLPEARRSAAEKVRKIKAGHDVHTWTPAEANLILEHVSPHWLPCEAIGLFAGLRKSEILRIEWSAFKWDLRDRAGNPAPMIAVSRKVARKIRTDRLVPILPNLASWLASYRERTGLLYPGNFKTNENEHSREMARIRKATGLARKDNANRHSFGSYRLAIVKNISEVAHEMGNSPRKVREDYNDPKPEEDAIKYFSICREEIENVVPLSLALEFG